VQALSRDGTHVTHTNQNPPAAETAKPATTGRKNLVDELPWLPLTVTVEIPVPDFTLEDLMNLRAGAIVKTLHQTTSDVPVRVNGKLIAWAKFEVDGDRLGGRITELA
jgi:flagellar motor switch/type III secretory pathway protein FliN